jgi:transcriptional regulator
MENVAESRTVLSATGKWARRTPSKRAPMRSIRAYHCHRSMPKGDDMYPLAPFRSSDPVKIAAVMRAFPLATLISPGGDDGWPTITQVPLVHHPERGARGTLLGHFDANNPHGPVLVREPRVTCLFHGPNHYITPSIYPVEHYPGWNYVTVRVHAQARPLTDREHVRALLFELAERHEPPGSGYVLRSEQRNFERYLDMVFGFELEIVEARAIFKLAQDKGPACADLAAVHLAREVREDVLPLLRELLGEEH